MLQHPQDGEVAGRTGEVGGTGEVVGRTGEVAARTGVVSWVGLGGTSSSFHFHWFNASLKKFSMTAHDRRKICHSWR